VTELAVDRARSALPIGSRLGAGRGPRRSQGQGIGQARQREVEGDPSQAGTSFNQANSQRHSAPHHQLNLDLLDR